MSQVELLSFVTIWVSDFCNNLSFWVLSQFRFFPSVFFFFFTNWVFEFCHTFSWVFSQFGFCHKVSFWVLSQFDFFVCHNIFLLFFFNIWVYFYLSHFEFFSKKNLTKKILWRKEKNCEKKLFVNKNKILTKFIPEFFLVYIYFFLLK